MAQTTFEKGVEQGFEKGVQTGIETGIERCQRDLLLRQLERRFGALSESARQRLEALPADRLTDRGDALLTASSLRELGLTDE